MSKIDYNELLKTCAEEKIQFLESIQEFACLIAIDRKCEIKIVSENFLILGNDPKKLIGEDFSKKLDKHSCESLTNFMDEMDFITNSSIDLSINNKIFHFYGYKTQDLIVFELELESELISNKNKDKLINTLVSSSISTNENSLNRLANDICVNIKECVNYDRVMMYKFHSDGHGEVIAESKNEKLEPFIGMHYPESDIPSQARKLYLRNLTRIIPDIRSKRISLYKDPEFDKPLDLSDSISRHVSPVHIKYLENMKVRSSMSISLVVDGELWGLIACHHYSPKFLSISDRSFLKFIGHSFSSEVSKLKSARLTHRLKGVNNISVGLIESLKSIESKSEINYLNSIVEPHKNSLLKLMNANGMFIQVGENISKLGKVPDVEIISFVKNKASENEPNSYFYTNSLAKLNSKFDKNSFDCSGVLSVGTSSNLDGCFIAWFRPERIQEIKWAGKLEKNITYDDGGVPRLSPRGSFDEVTRVHKNESLAFDDEDVDVAYELLWFLNKVLLYQLQRTKKNVLNLENQAKSKDNFISNLSHELRTPLNNILGWLQLYEDQLSEDPELKELKTVIKQNSNQQLKLVNDLLEMSKIATGKIELNMKPIRVDRVLKNIEKYFTPSFNQKDIKFTLTLDDDGAVCMLDKVRFEQIIRNILQNSLKFTPKHGSIHLLVKKLDSDIFIQIVDNGEGIEKSQIKKVFRQFHQVDDEKSRNNDGLGLGLALVKNLVELHGGKVNIESEGLDKGTTVSISLPISTSAEVSKKVSLSKEVKPLKALNGKSILLVEDTIESARFVKMYLEKEGADVLWLDNAFDALNAVKTKSFDLVISDIGLPNMDGIEFIEFAKTNEEASKTPFIALSAYGAKAEIKKSIDAGYIKHLVKPINLKKLVDVVLEEIL